MDVIDVNPASLGDEAAAVTAQAGGLDQSRADLEAAAAAAASGCGSVPDGGLRAALGNLGGNWGYDIAAIGGDASGVAGVMSSLARLYAQADTLGAQELSG